MATSQEYYQNAGYTTAPSNAYVQNYTANAANTSNAYYIPNTSNVQTYGLNTTPNSSNVQNYENAYTTTQTPQQVYQSYANPNINVATLQNSISRDNPSSSTSRPSRHPVKTYTRIITTEFPPSHLFPAPGVLLQKAIDEYQKTHKDHILTTTALPPPTPRPVITSQPTTPKSSAPATPAEPAEPPPPVYVPAPRNYPEQSYQYMWWQVVDPNKQQQQQVEEQAPLTPELSFMQKKSFRATGGSVTLQLVFLTLQYPVSVPASSTIGSVKGRISSMFNIPVEEIKLYSLGQPLQDSNHIQLMGLTDGSLIDLKLESQSLGSPKLQHAFPVTITTNGQAVTTVTVKGADTVVHLKYCVCQSLGGQLYPGWVRLFLYDGRELKTGVVPGTAEEYYFTLWSQLVRGPCSIQMLEPNPGPHPQDGQVPVYVRTQSGKTIQIRINASDTIYDVKLKIMATEDLTPEEQRLIFSGKVLDDGLKVSDYTIQKDATMHLVQKPLN